MSQKKTTVLTVTLSLLSALMLPALSSATTPSAQSSVYAEKGSYENPLSWNDETHPGQIHYSSLRGYYEANFTGRADQLDYFFPDEKKNSERWFYRGDYAGTYAEPKPPGDYSYKGAIYFTESNGFWKSLFNGPFDNQEKPIPDSGESNENWAYLGTMGGSYARPYNWGAQTVPGNIHTSEGRDFFESRFTGSASSSNRYFPENGKDNNSWFWRGAVAGDRRAPKPWNDYAYPGAVFKSSDGRYFTSKFNGRPDLLNKPFPSGPRDDDSWTYMGTHSGLPDDMKTQDEATQKGALHRIDNVGIWEARFSGQQDAYAFPPEGQSNDNWYWRGRHAGTFRDPKPREDYSWPGAIHGSDSDGRYEARFSGIAESDWTYPVDGKDNKWWKVLALDCPAPDYAPPADARLDISVTGSSPSAIAEHLDKMDKPTQIRGRYKIASIVLTDNDNKMRGSAVTVKRDDGGWTTLIEMGDDHTALTYYPSADDKPAHINLIHDDSMPKAKENDADLSDVQTSSYVRDTLALSPPETNGDRDCSGNRVADLFAGFSQSAATQVTDPEAWALAQIETVNQALRNSRVQGIRLRLAGTQIIEKDYPINIPTYELTSELFGAAASAAHADLTAAFYNSSSGQNDSYQGYASQPGTISIQRIKSPYTFRHEVGHNAGGGHCNSGTESSYKYGYGPTAQCGDRIAFYSTPDVRDDDNNPLGIADIADMARLWRERATIISTRSPAKDPVRGVIW